jgi:ketosteroid isomerase-like protein
VINGRAMFWLLGACAAALCWTQPAAAQPAGISPDADSVAVALAVEQFRRAIATGDSAGVAALLDPEAVILESGDLETRSEYLRGHLAADIAFDRAVRSTRRVVKLVRRGDAAWVVSTSRAVGTFETRPVDSDGAELIVLARAAQGWRIVAIHWSSHRHRP